ncbi:MAG: S-layer protein [Planctomycetaceae bacterium]|nr:S-layer protein [Planctomycetaceae bacterium]
MIFRRLLFLLLLLLGGTRLVVAADLEVFPTDVDLRYRTDLQRVVVVLHDQEESREVTSEVIFEIVDAKIVTVSQEGIIRPGSNGNTVIRVRLGELQNELRVGVTDYELEGPVSFELHIQPILAARGCSTGACHGKARGQNGFQLSLLGFDSEFDFNALTREARGRRIFPASPKESLLLKKGAGHVPHGGGIRLPDASDDYETILRWIEMGAPREIEEEPVLESVQIFPADRVMVPMETQQLVVIASYSDGTKRDVTGQSAFQSNESVVVGVSEQGVIRSGPIPGEATIMARFMGAIATCRVLIPLAGDVPDQYYADLPRNNFIDSKVWDKLQLLGITASDPAVDTKIVRRLFIDIIGRLPTPEETQQYVDDVGPDKRTRLVDWLLEQPEYADHWANKWTDLLRPNPYRVGIKAVLNYDNWIREAFRENRPYDEFVRGLVTAEGSTFRNGASTLFRDRRSPDEVTTLVSQLFLGIRLDCAKCHHHPFERWSQEDFYSFAAFFARVGRKGTGLSPPISGSEEVIMEASSGSVSHPLTGTVLSPKPLYGAISFSQEELQSDYSMRGKLADWMVSTENDYFGKVMANRVWADMMGRGLVEPVDDLRATNPATNEPLLAALGEYFAENKYDIKKLIGVIAKSYVYGLSSEPTKRNVADTRNYSRHYRVRLRAEVLLDAISDITAMPNNFSAMPYGSRSNQIWTHRVTSLFLDTFGRPDPNQDPPCERTPDSTVTQILHLMNSPELHAKVTNSSNAISIMIDEQKTEPADVIKRIYLLCYSREPDDEEIEICSKIFAENQNDHKNAASYILWALMNTPEFTLKD